MRIICRTVEAFVENLRLGEVFEHVVWIDVTRREINELKFVVNLQASAVLDLQGGQALLQYGEDCGMDLLDGDPELEGTEAAAVKRRRLVGHCDDAGLKVRPGSVDE